MSDQLYNAIILSYVIWASINLSQRQPVLLSLKIEYVIEGNENVSGNLNIDSPESRAKLAWHQASEYQLHQYRRKLDNLLSNIKVPDALINYDDKSCDRYQHIHVLY